MSNAIKLHETLYTLFHLNTTEILVFLKIWPFMWNCVYLSLKKTFTSRLKSEHNTTIVNMVSQEDAFKSQLI